MLHFTNQELAAANHVSVRTVRNWIESAKTGKLDLTLHTIGERSYIANTSKNLAVIQALAVNGKKYRPHRAYKTITPRAEFYEIYSIEQIYDIVSNLDIYHEIPHQYSYFAGGASYWDNYAGTLAADSSLNPVTATVKLIDMNLSYIAGMIAKYKKVNVIDIGAGNASPVKNFLAYLLEQGKLGRYIALDISPEMLKIAERNIHDWFADSVTMETHEIDINHDRFTHITAKEYLKKDSDETINILLLFGGSLANLRSPAGALKVIHDSMGAKDLLIYEKKLDNAASRRFFDFTAQQADTALAPIFFGSVVDVLNIDRSLYDVEMGYDEERHERFERIKIKLDLTIKFEFDGGRSDIHFNKDDAILVWRSKQQSALDIIRQFDSNDFHPIHTSQTDSQEYMLMISRIKRV